MLTGIVNCMANNPDDYRDDKLFQQKLAAHLKPTGMIIFNDYTMWQIPKIKLTHENKEEV